MKMAGNEQKKCLKMVKTGQKKAKMDKAKMAKSSQKGTKSNWKQSKGAKAARSSKNCQKPHWQPKVTKSGQKKQKKTVVNTILKLPVMVKKPKAAKKKWPGKSGQK